MNTNKQKSLIRAIIITIIIAIVITMGHITN